MASEGHLSKMAARQQGVSPLSLNLVLSKIITGQSLLFLFGSPPRTANFRGAFSALQVGGVNSFMEPPGQGVQLPNAVILPARNFKRPCHQEAPRPFSGENASARNRIVMRHIYH
jgi:hypothetical protein